MPKPPKGFHKCADGKTMRRKISKADQPINPRAKSVGSQRMRTQRRRERERTQQARLKRRFEWEGTGSRAYTKLPWWSKLIYRVKVFFTERERNRKKHKALYKKSGRIKPRSQFDLRPPARREQHK